jgi:membrane protein
VSLPDAFGLLKAAVMEWNEDKAPRLGAALAYYTIFSLAPLLIIAIAVAGLVFGQEAAQGQIVDQFRALVGQSGAELIENMIAGARRPSTSILAAGIGLVTLLVGALGVFGQLQDALNTIWEVMPRPGRGIPGLVKDRLLSLTMVLGVAFLLLVSLVISAGFGALGNWIGRQLPGLEALLDIVNVVVSFGITTLLFALMFKYIPDAVIAWGEVWIGAVITSLLFTLGKLLIGLYLGNSSIGSSYGAAGSLVLLLLWVYYSAQIFFFGAEFTQVYAHRFGSRIIPKQGAIPASEASRTQAGLSHGGPPGSQGHSG